MNAYRIYLADGTDYVTSMNATLEEAVRYFFNKELNVGQGGEDRIVRVLRVEPAETLNLKVKPPCVNSDAQQEMTHDDDAPEYQPCPICKATEPNFDGYCQQCEVPLEKVHVHEWNPLAALPNSDWQDVCITCGAHRIVKQGTPLTP